MGDQPRVELLLGSRPRLGRGATEVESTVTMQEWNPVRYSRNEVNLHALCITYPKNERSQDESSCNLGGRSASLFELQPGFALVGLPVYFPPAALIGNSAAGAVDDRA